MGAVRMYARSLLRRKVAGTIAVALLVGIAGAAVLGALAGARRTDSAFPRLLDRVHTSDVTVIPHAYPGVDPAEIAKLPHVAKVAPILGFGIADRPKDGGAPGDFSVYAAAGSDGVALYDLDRYDLLEGRLPKPGRVHEVLVNETLARRLHARLGLTYRTDFFNFAELQNAPQISNPTPEQIAQYFTPIDLTIVGVGRSPSEILHNENQDQDSVLLTPAFARKFGSRASYNAIGVKLHDPVRDLASFESAVRERFPGVQIEFQSRAATVRTFGRSVGPYADALRLFALVAALTASLVVGQAAMRLVALDGEDGAALQALGQTRAQRAGSATVRAAVAALAGGVGAVLLASAFSPLFPIGPARRAEIHAGLRLDGLVLGVGFVVIVLLVLVPAALVAWRLARRPGAGLQPSARPSRAAENLGRMGAPASAVPGVRFALQRDRRPGGASLGATLFGLVAAIATIGAALTFGSSLDRLVTTPQRYGWNWDVLLDTYENNASPELISSIRAEHDLPSVTIGSRGTLVLSGRSIPAFAFTRVRGDAVPEITEGRFPPRRDEVALGAQTLRDLHRSVGDTVPIKAADGTVGRMRVVGRTILPSLSLNEISGIGEGAAVSASALRRLDPEARPSFFLANLRPGVGVAAINHRYGDTANALGPQRPGDITSYAGVRATPLIFAALLAVLGLGVLAHLLVTSVRGRRRDLAVLKTIGFARRQIGMTVAWQATTLVVIALGIGIPVGLVAGRLVWRRFADDLGVGAGVVVPALAFALNAVVALALANLIAAVPARTAARTRAAVVLRSE